MKTIFIVNPKAGQAEDMKNIIDSINKSISGLSLDTQIYLTKSAGDAKTFAENYCENNGPARFIACGGDGTLNEVLNGIINCKDAEVGVIPNGTGNDFCRNFRNNCDFKDISAQLCGKTIKCDVIKYTTVYNETVKTGYCMNMFNIGFDCDVADLTSSLKKKPLISGPFAYFLSILLSLIKKKGADLCIELDGKVRHNGKLLLTSVANGSYCGGGIKSNPLAETTDGLININIIKNVSRCRFITLLPHYMKGTFLQLPDIERYISSEKCRYITITPNDRHIRLCIDGEIIDAGKTHFEVIHKAVNFVLPCSKVCQPDMLGC